MPTHPADVPPIETLILEVRMPGPYGAEKVLGDMWLMPQPPPAILNAIYHATGCGACANARPTPTRLAAPALKEAGHA